MRDRFDPRRAWPIGDRPEESPYSPREALSPMDWYGEWGQPRGEAPEPYAGRWPRGFGRDDRRIREDVCDRMTAHSALDPSDVEVEVRDQEVWLRGTVTDRFAKRLAEDIAIGVAGVRDVHNELRIGRPRHGEEGLTRGRDTAA